MPAPSLRPRTVTEILDAAFHLYRAHFVPLSILAALALFPFIVWGAALVVATLPTGDGAAAADPSAAQLAVLGGLGAVVFLLLPVFVAWFLVTQAALQKAMADAALGEPVSWSGAIRFVLQRFWRLVGASILKMLVIVAPMMAGAMVAGIAAAIFAPLLALVVPALVVAILVVFARLALVPATVVLEENGAGVAVRRSWELVSGHVGRTIGALLLAYLIVAALQLTLMGVGAVLANMLVGQLVANLASIVTYPIVAGVTVLLYYDLRIRKEGFDLELMTAELERIPETPYAAERPLAPRIR